MNLKIYSTISILFATITITYAQPVRVSTMEQMLEVAAECLEAGDYVNALEWYDNAYKEEKNYDLVPIIADLYVKIRHYDRAVSNYERIFKREKKENEFLQYRLPYAEALKAAGNYQAALDNFKIVLDNNPSEADLARAMLHVNGINQYNTLSDNIEVDINPADENINNASAESRPIEYTDGTLYFSSFNRRNAIDLSDVEEKYHMKIYKSKTDDKGIYEKPKALPTAINRDDYHTSNPAFSEDGREMYFTRTKMEGAKVVLSQLMVSYAKDDGWKPPVELPENINGQYIIQHPAVGELFGGRVLFFSSDMPGGKGGFDLYYANILGENSYSTPVNLSELNTAGDDITPFYQEGTLYFSSDGWPTIGGFDIFSSVWNGESWSSPANMGLGYNSSLDDMYLSFSKEKNRGYLVSNRPSKNKRKITSETCCDDIFTLNIREVVIDLLTTVNDTEGGALNGATVSVITLTGSADTETKKEETSNAFNFLLDSEQKYRVVATKPGYYPDSLEFNTVGIIDDYTINKTFSLKAEPKVVVPEKDPNVEIQVVTTNEPIRLNRIYYDLDDDKILRESEQDLNLLLGLMDTYDDMVIELSSHTDSRGKKKYNENLSQRRSDSAKRWLVQRGVEAERIVAVGYGEEQLLNGCTDGVKCSEDEHRLNRRTEFKILSGPTTIEIRRDVKPSYNGGRQSYGQHSILLDKVLVDSLPTAYPVFEFADEHFNVGDINPGEKKSMLFTFTNVGDADLIIELVTACKCTSIDWTRGNIAPGQSGEIYVQYDSSFDSEKIGKIEKIVDVISNAEKIVKEISFEGNLLPKKDN